MPYSKDYHLTKNAKPAIRAYLGGSFDPVHNGHLQMALYVYQSLLPIAKQQQHELQVSLLPNARSPFKADSTDPKHRLTMLKLAIKNTPLQINELELWQTPPVYTIDSVKTLRTRYPNDSLIFIMGMDSARGLDKWKEGLQLTDYVNLWVFNREQSADFNKNSFKGDMHAQLTSQLPVPLQPFITDSLNELVAPASRHLTDNAILKNQTQGRIYIDPRPVRAVSSTQVRQLLHQQCRQRLQSPQLMPQSLNIKQIAKTQIASLQSINAIISSTAPNPFAKWLNPAVYQYIIAHQLYSAAQFR